MESVQAVAEDAPSDGGATKLMKKPGGPSVARGTPADDGGRRSAPSRAETKNGNSLSHSASMPATSASNRAVASNGRGSSTTTTAGSSAVTAKMSSALSSASLHTRSLDRKTLLKHRLNLQLQPADREWVRADLHRGCIHVHDRLTSSYPRPVLCTMDNTAGEVALRLSKLCSKSSSVIRIFCKDTSKTDQNGNCNVKCEFNDDSFHVKDGSLRTCNQQTSLGSAEVSGHPGDRLRLLLMENANDRQKQQEVDGKLFTPESESQDNITCSLSDLNSNMDIHNDDDSEHRNGVDSYGLNSGSDVESSAFDDLSSGARLSEHRDSLSDDMILGTEASILSPSFDSATEGHDMYGSSSDELELDCPVSGSGIDHSNGISAITGSYTQCSMGHLNDMTKNVGPDSRLNSHSLGSLPPSSSAGSLSRFCSTDITPGIQDCGQDAVKQEPTVLQNGDCSDTSPTLYVQMHGEAVRRLSPDERPLQIQNDFLFKLGFKDPWRVQEEGLNTEIGSLLRFYAAKALKRIPPWGSPTVLNLSTSRSLDCMHEGGLEACQQELNIRGFDHHEKLLLNSSGLSAAEPVQWGQVADYHDWGEVLSASFLSLLSHHPCSHVTSTPMCFPGELNAGWRSILEPDGTGCAEDNCRACWSVEAMGGARGSSKYYNFSLVFLTLPIYAEHNSIQENGVILLFSCPPLCTGCSLGIPTYPAVSSRMLSHGTYNVRKGKLQLPVNRWTRRQVILCGTCLIVSSVKESQIGKMHILPLIGGKVEEVKKHNHCLAFSSAGPQSQTYYVSFDSFTEHLRWHRHAAKMVSQRINSVDLSCCSLELLPPNLFYSHDLTHLNLKHNFLPADHRLQQLQSCPGELCVCVAGNND
ncbi:hypothetical protein CCH79_00005358 [Gambusia affinis]|uniref:PHLPP-like RA domain-containing protein n=1 Tax=Gambusia affinis TaxID=33528 RepID=A0A315VQG5_GAMAF|nr:hypothetical protein CCH79_00005358 [Gambusia affinis]